MLELFKRYKPEPIILVNQKIFFKFELKQTFEKGTIQCFFFLVLSEILLLLFYESENVNFGRFFCTHSL